jgi:hypothetical protein
VSGRTRQTARSAVISPALTSSIWRRRRGKKATDKVGVLGAMTSIGTKRIQ